MEQYGLDELAASAERVMAGLGPLVAGLVRLAGGAGRAVTLDAMEEMVLAGGRELLRGVMQHALDAQAAAEVRLPAVTGADGIRRARAERGHSRAVVTMLGQVRARRIAYRAGVKGVPSLFPRDGVLNLPRSRYSWQLQQLVVMTARDGAYEMTRELVLAVTGTGIGKRQLEEIVASAAADAAAFCAVTAQEPDTQEPGELQARAALGMSADGKGVSMRPQSRRQRTVAPDQRKKQFEKHPGIGEKGVKRMAEVACVWDVIPAPRTPEQVMASHHGAGEEEEMESKPAPEALCRRYTVDITADRSAAISWLFDEGERRDPGHGRDWVALVDGDNHQIRLIQAQAAARDVKVTILIDLIHVLEYLWKAGWAFHDARDPAIETWAITQALDILHGRSGQVLARIEQLEQQHPPASTEHAKNIRKVKTYLANKQPYLDYPRALANGWPVATGIIEGACRHLVQDRMGITGARWSTEGAQAILWLRVIHANHDDATYWQHHLRHEHQRNHLSRYQDTQALAA